VLEVLVQPYEQSQHFEEVLNIQEAAHRVPPVLPILQVETEPTRPVPYFQAEQAFHFLDAHRAPKHEEGREPQE
jgi:hypothetical protein